VPRNLTAGYGSWWFDGVLSERPISVRRHGKMVIEWVHIPGIRNEPLDCRVYATAALEILGPSAGGMYHEPVGVTRAAARYVPVAQRGGRYGGV